MFKNPKSKIQNPNQSLNPKSKNKYEFDLLERTAKFGENIIKFAKSLPENTVNRPLINQIVRSGTSIGANYMEADAAESKKDFRHKVGISKKESKESMHWLRMISVANENKKDDCRKLWKEAHEFVLMFSSMLRNK